MATSMNRRKFTPARRLDYIYDPVFFVSGARDHMRAAMTALMTSGEIGIQPTYRSMFSDCPHYPRNRYVLKDSRAPRVIDVSWEGRKRRAAEKMCVRPLDVKGADRFRFFEPPSQLFTQLVKEPLRMPPRQVSEAPAAYEKYFCSVEVQTAYRESSAQTHPWDPGYKVQPGTKPELMTLAWLAWKKGLPVGMNEIQLIHRARMRREWEEQIYLNASQISHDECRKMLEAIETEQYEFRAKELQEVQDYRLQIVMEIYRKRREKFRDFHERRISRIWEKKKAYREKKFLQIKRSTDRAIRKLGYIRDNVIQRFPKADVYEELISPCAEGYAPLLRNGLHPKRIHAVLHKKRNFTPDYEAFYNFDTMPNVSEFEKPVVLYSEYASEVGVPPELWTDEDLEAMQEEVIRIARGKKKKKAFCTRLLTKIAKPPHVVTTPEVTRVSEADEEEYQSLTLVQRLVKGRAIHGLMFNGRATAMETITELRSTHHPLLMRVKSRRVVGKQKRFQLGLIHGIQKVKEPALFVEASSLGQMVELLHKEVLRLEDEQSTYALRMLAKRTRWIREAKEAGHRQKEENRRNESDYIYKLQNLKIHQDVVDMFLEDVVVEGIDHLSDFEAKKYVKQLALKVDAAASEAMESYTEMDEITMITECVHQFIAPEVEKQSVRDQLKMRQTKHLEIAHDLVFATMNDLQKFGFMPSEKGSSTSLDILNESQEALNIVRKIESELLRTAVGNSADGDLKLIRQIESELLKFVIPVDEKLEGNKTLDLTPADGKDGTNTTEREEKDNTPPVSDSVDRSSQQSKTSVSEPEPIVPKLELVSETEVELDSNSESSQPKSTVKHNTPATTGSEAEDT